MIQAYVSVSRKLRGFVTIVYRQTVSILSTTMCDEVLVVVVMMVVMKGMGRMGWKGVPRRRG